MIPFSPPRMDQKTVKAVEEVLLSGWITTGPKTKEFERQLTTYTGCRKTLCLSSATAGLEMVLRWFGVGEGDEVIIPAYTYCATANVVVHCGATPVMVDIDPNGFNIAVDQIKKHITSKTKVIIPVDIGGIPCNYNEINELVKSKEINDLFNPGSEAQNKLGRILVMADAAHSVGASYHDKMSGALTDITVFSFHAVKNLTTSEGGAICLNLPDEFDCDAIYQELNIKSLHGQSKDALAKTQIGNWRYDVLEPGYKCNMMDIQAAIGLVELERYDETLERRQKICLDYAEGLTKNDWAEIQIHKGKYYESSYHLFHLNIKGATEEQRDQIITKIFEKGVSVNVHFIPLPMLTAYKSRGYKMEDYPESYQRFASVITLPVYYHLTDDQVQQVMKAIEDSVEEVIC